MRTGQGDRLALFIHCSLASHAAWLPVMHRLGGGLRMTAFDLPGHGGSDPWDGSGEIQGRSAAVAATFCDGPTDLVGHSFGATVALRLALDRPELVRRLVLVEPVLFAAVRGTPAFDAYRADHAPVADAMARGDREAAARHFVGLWGTGAPWGGLPAAQRRGMAARIGLVAEMSPALETDAGDLLARLATLDRPVLLARGALTHPVIPAIHEALAARLPDARQAVVSGARHMSPLTHPAAVARKIGAHLGL